MTVRRWPQLGPPILLFSRNRFNNLLLTLQEYDSLALTSRDNKVLATSETTIPAVAKFDGPRRESFTAKSVRERVRKMCCTVDNAFPI